LDCSNSAKLKFPVRTYIVTALTLLFVHNPGGFYEPRQFNIYTLLLTSISKEFYSNLYLFFWALKIDFLPIYMLY